MSGVFDVPFRADRFPVSVARRGVFHFDESDLAHALFVTGRAPADANRHGSLSVWEWLHRTSLIPAYLRRDPADRLMKSGLADSLDRSEKVGLSYALGQAMTGIFCERNLGVTHLMHVDRYASRWRLQYGTGAGRRRADLFGRVGPKRWVVAEAKGRSNGMERALRQTLVDQKSTVRTVAGHAPVVALGCVASFPTMSGGGRGSMRVDAVDPEPDEGIDLEITEDRFFRAYYETFATAVDAGQRTDGPSGYVTATYQGNGLRIGLRSDLYETVRSTDRAGSARWTELLASEDVADDRPDGTFVLAEWAETLAIDDYDG